MPKPSGANAMSLRGLVKQVPGGGVQLHRVFGCSLPLPLGQEYCLMMSG
jgi:hypothetical protein